MNRANPRPAPRLSRWREVTVFVPLVFAVVLFVALVPRQINRQVEKQAGDRVVGLAGVLASALAVSLEFDDTDDARRVLGLLASQQDAREALVLDGDGQPFARWQRTDGGGEEPTQRAGGNLVASVPVKAAGGTLGKLIVSFDAGAVDAQKRANWLAAFALVLLGGGALGAMVARLFLRRQKAERALADEEAKFAILVEGMPDALMIHHAGWLRYANSAARRLFELGDATGTDPAATGAITALGEPVPGESRIVEISRPGGSGLHLEVRAFALTMHDDPVTITIARDVTEETQLRQRLALSDRMASIGTLTTGVAHEINNPLTYILANVEFVKSKLASLRPGSVATEDGELIEDLEIAMHDAEVGAMRVQRIVTDMRKMARKDFGERAPVDLRGLITGAVQLARASVGQRAEFEVDLADLPPVLGSDTQLTQVFINLLVNGAHAIPTDAPPDRRWVRIRTSRTTRGGALISVADSGAGIPAAIRDKIFDPFFTTKPVGVGTGLGLAICHGIVRAHGGTIQVDSEVGRGTTMRIALPPAPTEAAVAPPALLEPVEVRAGKILVVDDEPELANATARLLATGAEVETSSQRALDRLAAGEQFDLVLCDVRMPGINGPELLEAVRRRAPNQARTFVFMTGALDQRSETEVARLGVPVLEKPFTRDTLHRFVEAQLQRLERAA